MNKPIQAVMVEHMDDMANTWVWYSVERDITPQQAVIDYCLISFEEVPELEEEDNKIYAKNHDVRAYYITIN